MSLHDTVARNPRTYALIGTLDNTTLAAVMQLAAMPVLSDGCPGWVVEHVSVEHYAHGATALPPQALGYTLSAPEGLLTEERVTHAQGDPVGLVLPPHWGGQLTFTGTDTASDLGQSTIRVWARVRPLGPGEAVYRGR